jgi:hypothetical protein
MATDSQLRRYQLVALLRAMPISSADRYAYAKAEYSALRAAHRPHMSEGDWASVQALEIEIGASLTRAEKLMASVCFAPAEEIHDGAA